MGFAEAIDCPVVLIADIDRGGVFAHFVGTFECLSASERDRVVGFVINRFRGERALLDSGIDWLEARSGKPVFGVLPYLQGLTLDAEDALPGSKNVRADLAFLEEQGWCDAILRHLRYGGKLIGLCGGMQMPGRSICDPEGVEGRVGESPGLGVLDLDTQLTPRKLRRNVEGVISPGTMREAPVEGYEINMGLSRGPACERRATRIDGTHEGAQSADAQVLATYVHGLFDHPAALAAILDWAGLPGAKTVNLNLAREAGLDRLADCIEEHLELGSILRFCGVKQ